MITCKKKMNATAVIVGSALFFTSPMETFALGIWISNANVSELGTSQDSAAHHVWFSGGGFRTACQMAGDQSLIFFEDQPGGKSMMATLTTALVANRKVDVLADDCNIVEVHLK